jgi:hypothetical protein
MKGPRAPGEVCLHNHDPFIDSDLYEPPVMMIKLGGEKGRKHKEQAFSQCKQSCAHPHGVRETERLEGETELYVCACFIV